MQKEINFSKPHLNHQELLLNLKKSVEIYLRIIRDSTDASADAKETIMHLQNAIKDILLNELDCHDVSKGQSYDLGFIENLNWLQPPAGCDNRISKFHKIIDSITLDCDDSLSKWIYTNLSSSNISEKLKFLFSDAELLDKYYNYNAFIRNNQYFAALLICISAIELNQSNLLTQIEQSLLFALPTHRRSNSHPHFSTSPHRSEISYDGNKQLIQKCFNKDWNIKHKSLSNKAKYFKKYASKKTRIRPWRSLPELSILQIYTRSRSKTISQPVKIPKKIQIHNTNSESPRVPTFTYNINSSSTLSGIIYDTPGTSRSSEINDLVPVNLVKCDDIKIYFDERYTRRFNNDCRSESNNAVVVYDSPPPTKKLGPMNFLSCISTNLFSPSEIHDGKTDKMLSKTSVSLSSDLMSVFLPREGEKPKNRNRKSFLFGEIDDHIVNASQTKRVPVFGQSLASFLQSAQFSRNKTDLERENAHFSISEAMISAIEQMKWTRMVKRRRKIQKLKISKTKIKNTAEICSPSGSNTGHLTDAESSISDSNNSLERRSVIFNFGSDAESEEEFSRKLSVSSHDLNDHTAFAEWGANNMDALSAEGVALSLISKFSDKQLPRASDIKWLVTEQDAPQELLPMPDFDSANPDEHYVQPYTRGTRDWAPPRAQIIFTLHPPPNRKKYMHKQNYRCAGCGMRVSPTYMHHYRYCYYLGKYHCTGCHRNQISMIPAKVLQRWDFTSYPVSAFAYNLLEQIWDYPTFFVPNMNAHLYKAVKCLRIVRAKRIQLKYIRDFIVTCRFAEKEKNLLLKLPSHTIFDPDVWSMSDCNATKEGTLCKQLQELIKQCEHHIFSCQLCSVRGFICEICKRNQVIYPWQMKIKRCDNCGTCSHEKCWRNHPQCAKCQRLKIRDNRCLNI